MIPNVPVRQDILTSWQRCVLAGLRPDRFEVPYRGVLSLSVRDDGVGGADPGGSGLSGLRERAEALGGTLLLTSPPGRGTCVDVKLPAAPPLIPAGRVTDKAFSRLRTDSAAVSP